VASRLATAIAGCRASLIVGFVAGRYRVAVTDPSGRRVTARARGARVLRGPTYAGVTVLGPAGRWTVTVTRPLGGPRVGTAAVPITTR
jgi:hypothetical protein